MKRKIIICIAVVLLLSIACLATGCGFLNTTDSLANSSEGSKLSLTTYDDVSRTDLEAALTQYREMAETLAGRVADLEELVQQSVAVSKANIGAYAVSYVDSVMSLTCSDNRYKSASSGGYIGCQGTGFIISEDGYVLTNNHVVSYENEQVVDESQRYHDFFGRSVYGTQLVSGEYNSITGVFDSTSQYYSSGKSYTLEFIYRDPAYDLALCKIVETVPVGEKWKAIPFYSGEVVRGDEVLLLGNAQGFGLSATSGLVSATGKTFTDYPKLTFIQTDAAINGGNSGGPAINIYGGLIGVVNSKFVNTSIENMGFAIELSKVVTFIGEAQTNKTITISYKTIAAPSIE